MSSNREINLKYRKVLDDVINNFLDTDTFKTIAPNLSPSETTFDNEFFENNKITVLEEYTSFEYKMMSVLAPFYKDRANTNPDMINKYMRLLGYVSDKKIVDILCLNKTKEYTTECDNSYISLVEYFKLSPLSKVSLAHTIISIIKNDILTHNIKSQATQGVYFNGWDIGFDKVSLK